MRYASTDIDGNLTLHATVPQKAINAEGKEFRINGIMRRNGECVIYGEMGVIVVGDETFDVSDMASDHVPGWTIVFPTFEEIQAKWYKGDKVVSHRAIKRDEVIADRTFRGAWRDKGKVEVDMPAAREIQRERIRKARVALLEALDVEYSRADEAGDNAKKRDIATEKQRLRDLTKDPRIDAAQTPDELKVILP